MKLAGLALLTSLLLADGSTTQLHQQSGRFLLTVFTAPVPLRTGPADVTVLIEDGTSGSPVLDATVDLTLHHPDCPSLFLQATREQATNKLLYAAQPILTATGDWDYRVSVRHDRTLARVSGRLTVQSPQPPLTAYWPYFAVVPAAVLLFAANRKLKAAKALKTGR